MKAKFINSLNEEFEKREKRIATVCVFIGTETRWNAFRQQRIKNRKEVEWCSQYMFKLKNGEIWVGIFEQPDGLRGLAVEKILLPKHLDYNFFCANIYPYLSSCMYLQWYGIADDELE